METTLLIPLLMVLHLASPQTMDALIKQAFLQMNSDITSGVQILQDAHGAKSTVGDGGPMMRVDMDMLFTAKQWADIQAARQAEKSGRKKRKALKYTFYRWTDNVVPYEFTRGHFGTRDTNIILAAMGEWEKHTCIKFRPATSLDYSKIYFNNGEGCSSNIGMLGWRQAIYLSPGCRVHRIIVHEIGHAIGMIHEQARPDRDNHVTIHYDNIYHEEHDNFEPFPRSTINDYGIPYDYLSLMHYGEKSFAMDPSKRTITTKDPYYQSIIGTVGHLSFRDIKLANLMYKCAAKSKCKDVKCPEPAFIDKNCECMCPGNPTALCSEQTTTTPTPPTTTTIPATTSTPTVPDKTTQRKCINKFVNCNYWMRKGYCRRKFVTYMARNCPLACKLCGQHTTTQPTTTPTTRTTTPTTTPTTTTSTARPTTTSTTTTTKKPVVTTCVDNNYRCDVWSSYGYCWDVRYMAYMKDNCAKSCTFCSAKKAICVNKRSSCSAWQQLGYCTGSYRAYMTKYCARSCGRCPKRIITPTKKRQTCIDKHRNCSYWARTGNCQRREFQTYMKSTCAKSCQFCR